MSHLQTSIEFHDSDLSACDIQDNVLVIELRPAYIHKWEMTNGKWIGTGCVQDANITIDIAGALKKMPAAPVKISDGIITIGNAIFDNLVPVPFHMNGPSRSKLQLVSGESLDVVGGDIDIKLIGESTFVENLPDEWAPQDK